MSLNGLYLSVSFGGGKKFHLTNNHHPFGMKQKTTKNGQQNFFVAKSFSDEICIFGDEFYLSSKTEFVVARGVQHPPHEAQDFQTLPREPKLKVNFFVKIC